MKRLRSASFLLVVLAGSLGTQGCAATIVPATSALGPAVSVASRMDARPKKAQVHPPSRSGLASAEAESYRQGVRDALDKLQKNGGLAGLPKQPETLSYVAPVMDEVWIPAQVVGGMVIPAHRQWVLMRPGAWQVPSAPGSLAGMQRTF